MGQVFHCGCAARDPKIHKLFQIADVYSGVIRWFNADLVTYLLPEATFLVSQPHPFELKNAHKRFFQCACTI